MVGMTASRPSGPVSLTPMSDWFNCTRCAKHVHDKFLAQPAAFFTGCIHSWRVPCRVSINFFVMGGAAVRRIFGGYTSKRRAFEDEPYFTALLTERTGMPSLMVTDAVVVHFAFGFQRMGQRSTAALLGRYRQLAAAEDVHEELRRNFGGRNMSRTCPDAPPAGLLQGRRTY